MEGSGQDFSYDGSLERLQSATAYVALVSTLLRPVPIAHWFEMAGKSSRAASPSSTGAASAITIAWNNARETLKKSLPEKDFRWICSLTSPEDILKELELWQVKHAESKRGKVVDQVRDGLARMQSFNRALDLLAQGTPFPGCLVWGSIVFVLTMLRHTTEEYDKICRALTRVIEYLPAIEIFTESFSESSLIQGCVGDFYCSLLRFWTKACKAYHRRRLWIFQKAWSSYDTKFGELEDDMIKYQERLEKLATAKHIHESRNAISEQQRMNAAVLKAQDLEHQRDIITWLAPATYDVDYYVDDLVNASAARHVNTCRWLLTKDAFLQFSQRVLQEGSLLWIYAQPGAGKTVLSAFLIDYFSNNPHSRLAPVLYFFCRNTDAEKNKPIAVLRSLAYQLFQALRKRSMSSSMQKDLTSAIFESGQKKATNFDKIWRVFFNHIADLASATIIVDALDECEDPSTLIKNFQSMTSSCHVSVILISRKEAYLYQLLRQSDSLEIMAEDIDADIKAFVEAKINASSCLSHPSVRDLVMKRLCVSHNGMFLWVYLVWKELKSCISVREVQEALQQLPSELNAVFTTIFERLQQSLDKPALRLCSKVLTWVLTAIRPLKMEELRQALTLHYQSEDHSLLCEDGSFPYSDKDIELVCGSLVHVRNGTLQIVHLTVKEYVLSYSRPDSSHELIKAESASSQLAIVCLSFLESNCTQSVSHFDTSEIDLQQLRINAPFIDYAVTFWMFHLAGSEGQDNLKLSKQFCKTFNSSSTFCWIETYLALHPSHLPDLVMFLDATRKWAMTLTQNCLPHRDSSFSFMIDWCVAMEQVLQEYGRALVLRPSQIHHLNLGFAFSTGRLAEMYETFGNINAREESSRFQIHHHLRQPPKELPSSRRLQGNFGQVRESPNLFLYDSRRDIYILSPRVEDSREIALFVQSATSGNQLRPVKCEIDLEAASTLRKMDVMAYDMSKDGKFLLIIVGFYEESPLWHESCLTLIWQVEEDLDFSKGLYAGPWACLKFKCVSDYFIRWQHRMCIAFRSDGVFCTPAGLIDSALKTVSPTSADILKILAKSYGDSVLYSGNGEYLFIVKHSVRPGMIEKFALQNLEKVAQFELATVVLRVGPDAPSGTILDIFDIRVVTVSPSGRYLVFGVTLDGYHILLDTISRKTAGMKWHTYDTDLVRSFPRFADDESEINILSAFPGRPMLEMVNYAGLPSNVFLKSRQVFPHSYQFNSWDRWYISNDHKLAIVATISGVIQRMKLSDKVEFLDEPYMIDDNVYNPGHRVFLSQDGDRLAHLYFGEDKACLEVLEISNAGKTLRHLELGKIGSDTRPMTMSPDLSILAIGSKIYNLGFPDDQIASRSFEIVDFPVTQCSWCMMSFNNTFIIYFGIGKANNCAFRLDGKRTSWVHVQPSLPGDAVVSSAGFHPSLPLMAIIYKLKWEGHGRYDRQTRNQSHVAIMDLNTESIRHVGDVGNSALPLVESTLIYKLKRERASNNIKLLIHGAMVKFTPYQECDVYHMKNFNKTSSCRFVPYTISQDDVFDTLCYDDRLYYLRGNTHDLSQSSLVMYYPGWSSSYHVELSLSNLVIMSQLFTVGDELYLLLGNNDDERMRLLLIPRFSVDKRPAEIKPIHVTWREARAELDRLWDEKWGFTKNPDMLKDLDSDSESGSETKPDLDKDLDSDSKSSPETMPDLNKDLSSDSQF